MSKKILTTDDLLNSLLKVNNELGDVIKIYAKLTASYIKNNKKDNLDDLNKQKKVIFSYLNDFENSDIKTVYNGWKEIIASENDINEIKSIYTPDRKIDFVKISYKNGGFELSAKNLSEPIFSNNTENVISNLVCLVDRLDIKEAAYSLEHAKNVGDFIIAALPYVRTEDVNQSPQKFIDSPSLSYSEPSDSSHNVSNMPVSRQFASTEDIKEGDSFTDNNGELKTISAIDNESITFTDNNIIPRNILEDNISNGSWKREADSSKETQIKNKMEIYLQALKEKEILTSSVANIANELSNRLEEITKRKIEQLDSEVENSELKIKKLAAKLHEIQRKENEALTLASRVKINFQGYDVSYNPEAPNARKIMVKTETAEQLLEEMKRYVSPENLASFNNLAEQLFQYSDVSESLNFSLNRKDPDINKKIDKMSEKLRKKLSSSLINADIQDKCYDILNNFITAGKIDFKHYRIASDIIDSNPEESYKYLKNDNNKIEADVIGDIKSGLSTMINWLKSKVDNILNYLGLQEKSISDIIDNLKILAE